MALQWRITASTSPSAVPAARGAYTMFPRVTKQYHTRVVVSSEVVTSPMPTFGEKLRFLRQRAGLTQRRLAEQLGYTDHSHITLIEQNKRNPTVELVLKVSDLFQVTADQLIRDSLTLDIDDESSTHHTS
jgi:DNA-binding XRE family transcriptional regulator